MSDAFLGFNEVIEQTKRRRGIDKKRFEELDKDLCMMCLAYGADKRILYIECMYAIHEMVPEAMDLFSADNKQIGYTLRICKACRGAFLDMLGKWREERMARRTTLKDHDGNDELDEPGYDIPVRVNGAIVMMNEDQYREFKEKKGE